MYESRIRKIYTYDLKLRTMGETISLEISRSDKPGYVMKVNDYEKAQGATIWKAMSSLDEGTGLVLTLVSLQ